MLVGPSISCMAVNERLIHQSPVLTGQAAAPGLTQPTRPGSRIRVGYTQTQSRHTPPNTARDRSPKPRKKWTHHTPIPHPHPQTLPPLKSTPSRCQPGRSPSNARHNPIHPRLIPQARYIHQCPWSNIAPKRRVQPCLSHRGRAGGETMRNTN